MSEKDNIEFIAKVGVYLVSPDVNHENLALATMSFEAGIQVAMRHPEWAQAYLSLMPHSDSSGEGVADELIRNLPFHNIESQAEN